jgi:hypothetical protein
MDPRTVAAQFAAYTWYQECHEGAADTQGQAARFARDNWQAFCRPGDEGLGRLLLRIGRAGRKRRQVVG